MQKVFRCMEQREWLFLIFSVFLLIAQVALDLKIPDYMGTVTMLVQTQGSTLQEILEAGAMMLSCSLGSLALTLIVTYFAAQIATTVARKLRKMVYDKTISYSAADINNFSIPSLITRCTNDITQVQSFLSIGFIALVRAPLMLIWASYKIYSKNVTFTIVTVGFVVSLLVVIFTLLKLTIPKSKRVQALTDALNTVTREHLTGIRVVRAYNAEAFQEDKFKVVNEDVTNTTTFINRAMGIMSPFMTFLMSALTLSIYWIGAFIINQASAADKLVIFSDMVVFTSYAMQIIMAFMMLTMLLMLMPRTMVVLERIAEVLDHCNVIKEGNSFGLVSTSNVAVEFRNVSFSYNTSKHDEMVLKDVSFKVDKGETLAFIGATGSGKSTIIQLLLRNYDVCSGEIFVDGVNIKDYTQETLQDKFGYVPQKATLFSGDVRSNVAYCEKLGCSVNSEQLKKAVYIAQAEDFVNTIGLEGAVAQGGLNLSGGQKQRLSIARALYKQAPIYLFDDCFSALDYRTDFKLRDAISKQLSNATKIYVAQRISTVKDAHQIIVLENGEVAGCGTHAQLLNDCSIYQEIVASQLSSAEAAI